MSETTPPTQPPAGPLETPVLDAPDQAGPARRFNLGGLTLRQVAARGTIVNAVFLTALSSLGLVRGFVLAHFLTREDYGLWGVLVISLGTLLWLKQVGVGDKYIQQDEPDQELAFQKAFTLEALFMGVFIVLMAAAVPLVVLVYGEPELLVPGFVIVAILPALALQAPLWVFYRQMRFVRQRALQAVDPIVGFVVAVGLAAAGVGYWAIVLGVLAGAWAAAVAAVLASPYRLRFRYDRGTMRNYVSFSWPLIVASGSGVVVAQASILAGEKHLGLAGAGAITLAATVSQFADRVDAIVTGTLYPAICAVRDQTALLVESFVKSNRLALMWAFPFGIGLALFAPDLVDFGIGDRWEPAVIVIQAFGLGAAINHIGFNWDAYFRARGETQPIMVVALTSMVAYLGAAIPLLILDGLRGFAIGVAAQTVVGVSMRAFFLRRLFVGFRMFRHALRGIAPTVPAAAVVLCLRLLETDERTGAYALGEFAAYGLVTVAATLVLERELLREAIGYVRARPA
jgi:O-antigen/teichoic acid export membrane protein